VYVKQHVGSLAMFDGSIKSISAWYVRTYFTMCKLTLDCCPSPMWSIIAVYSKSVAFHIGWISLYIVNRGQKWELLIDAPTISACVPCRMTGHVWWKSPISTMTFPLNATCYCITIWHTSCIHDRLALFAIGTLCQMMRSTLLIRCAQLWFCCIGDCISWLC
jgi:hypothetical protein